ncbi:hypothetical protein CLAIMM_02862 [Cladophialophora immunda]|nr:hypothetical protein CLAIMM_02862 [Cladophialophora immunda]
MQTSLFSLLVAAFFARAAAQQTIDPLSIIVSEAFSVYTEVNSLLSSAASAVSAAAGSAIPATGNSSPDGASTTSNVPYTPTSYDSTSSEGPGVSGTPSTSSAPLTSTSISSASSPSLALTTSASVAVGVTSSSTPDTRSLTTSSRGPSSTTSSLTLSSPVIGTSSVLGAAAGSGTSTPSLTKSRHESDLPIILGCVLGALALGLSILALVICFKRRRLSSSPRHSALSPGDDEVESWRVSRPSDTAASHGSLHRDLGVAGTAPLMSEHPAFRNPQGYENPFVPVPPPPRRTAPNSRPGLTDGMAPGDDPFVKEITGPSRSDSVSSTYSTHHTGGIAAGIAAAAAGADLMHHSNEYHGQSAPAANGQPIPARINRKPVPVQYTNNSEPWPYSPVSPIDPVAETAGLTTFPTRSSGESGRSFSRDPARANAVFDQEYAPHSEALGHDDPELGAAAAGLGAGLAGGAALGYHGNHGQHRSRSRSSSSKRRSRPAMPIPSAGLDTSGRTSRDDRNSQAYRDVVPQESYGAGPAEDQDVYGVPATLPSRSRRNSALGSALPGAAAFNYANRPTVPSPLSSEVRRDRSSSPRRSRSRSLSGGTARFSFSYDPVADDYGAYPPFPITSSTSGQGKTGRDEAFTDLNMNNPARPDKAIVNDKSYPQLDIPRRQSTNEYDLAATSGPLGPSR